MSKPRSWAIGDRSANPIALTNLENRHYKNLFNPDFKPVSDSSGETSTCTVRGLYRGCRFHLKTTVRFHPRANTIMYQYRRPRNRSAILVLADDKMHKLYNPEEGSVAILVDLSGSMNWATKDDLRPLPPKKDRRITQARAALKEMLNALPAGIEVSLWVFNGRFTKRATAQNKHFNRKHIGPPANKDYLDRLEEVDKWGPGDAETFLAKFDLFEPHWGTPLIDSMEVVRKYLKKSTRNTKTLIVLTDGGDDALKQGGREAKAQLAKLRAFNGTGIIVHAVGFHITSKEIKWVKQFEKEIEQLKTRRVKKQGTFYYVDNLPRLITILRESLKWKYVLAHPETTKLSGESVRFGIVGRTPNSRRGTRGLKNWLEISPGQYSLWENKLFIPAGNRDGDHRIDIRAGDLRVYELKNVDGVPTLNRALFSPRLLPLERLKMDEENLLAVVDNIPEVGGHGQSMLVLIENRNKDRKDTVPEMVWLELHTPTSKGEAISGVRWGDTLGYPAAAWRLEVARAQDRAVLHAWIRYVALFDDAIRRGENRPLSNFNGRGRELKNKTTVRIESVRVEQFSEVNERGVRHPSRKMFCVVVRLSYPIGKPVFVQLDTPVNPRKGGGYEHHFYEAGREGKYTGIFWYGPEQRESVEDRVKVLQLFALDSVKNREGTRHLAIPLDKPQRVQPVNNYLQHLGLR
jgi:hypothetical protein